ncbi:hypothetical protein [Actinomycetospora termitidis]|uniref:Uncharacterized protein n=1 Tax=Actinomycetospora termitidis TaxID=3053470 RepID=A0ABT7M7W1_9PSEU|nr:hypothetical protein [Actinomycetospora sp. Odt1-22]MDL5156117.1 hypothetical protein [Actinomycetospora sp. Odt1-22]
MRLLRLVLTAGAVDPPVARRLVRLARTARSHLDNVIVYADLTGTRA